MLGDVPAMDVYGVKVRICYGPNACEPTIDGQCKKLDCHKFSLAGLESIAGRIFKVL